MVAVGALAVVLLGGLWAFRMLHPSQPASLPPTAGSEVVADADNGRLPDEALSDIGGGYRLTTAAAAAFTDLEAAAEQAGFTLQVNSAYRSYDEQIAMVEEYGLLSEGGRAAEPGTSEHGWGTAVDLTLDADQLAWFQANAPSYGFAATIAGEPWHWAYVGTD